MTYGAAISPIISKVFKRCILDKFGSFDTVIANNSKQQTSAAVFQCCGPNTVLRTVSSRPNRIYSSRRPIQKLSKMRRFEHCCRLHHLGSLVWCIMSWHIPGSRPISYYYLTHVLFVSPVSRFSTPAFSTPYRFVPHFPLLAFSCLASLA